MWPWPGAILQNTRSVLACIVTISTIFFVCLYGQYVVEIYFHYKKTSPFVHIWIVRRCTNGNLKNPQGKIHMGGHDPKLHNQGKKNPARMKHIRLKTAVAHHLISRSVVVMNMMVKVIMVMTKKGGGGEGVVVMNVGL